VITISKKASQLWVSSDYSDKQRLQYLIYPDGILYNKENNTVRTPRVNSLFTAISCLSYISAENKNGQPTQIDQNSRWVELQGIEPWSKHIRYKPSTCLVIHCLSEENRGITNQFSS